MCERGQRIIVIIVCFLQHTKHLAENYNIIVKECTRRSRVHCVQIMVFSSNSDVYQFTVWFNLGLPLYACINIYENSKKIMWFNIKKKV